MVTSPQAVANVFLELAKADGKELSNLKLQKLVFLAHGFSLALFDKPLQYRDVHAWQYGPVIPHLYKSLRKYGADKVTEPIETDDKVDNPSDEYDLIKTVWKSYSRFSASQLVNITHKKDAPWAIAWEKKTFSMIDSKMLKDYYVKYLSDAKGNNG